MPGSALCHSTGEAMAGSPCTPTSSIPTCAACVPKQAAGIPTSPSGRLGSSSPSTEHRGWRQCQHRDEPLAPCLPLTRAQRHAKGQNPSASLVLMVTTAAALENELHSIQALSSLFMSHLKSLHLQNFLNNLWMVDQGGRGTRFAENQVTEYQPSSEGRQWKRAQKLIGGKRSNSIYVHTDTHTPEMPLASEDI